MPMNADTYPAQINAAKTLEAEGRFEEAQHSFQRILEQHPQMPEPLYRLALLAVRSQDSLRAQQLFHQVAVLAPRFPQVFYNLGLIAQAQNQMSAAIEYYENAISLKPDYLPALINLGHVLQLYGRTSDALAVLQRAVVFAPNDAAIRNNLGTSLRRMDQSAAAVEELQRACALQPGSAIFHSNLSAAYRDLGQLDEAERSLATALSIDATLAEAHNNLGGLRQQQGELDAALQAYIEATRLRPNYVEAWVNLAGVYLAQFDNQAAEAICNHVLGIDAQSSEALHHLANIADRREQPDLAYDFLRLAIEANPNNAEAHGALAAFALADGDFVRGWQEFGWRPTRKTPTPGIAPRGAPLVVLPEHLAGKVFLLHAEQGLGDILFFLRWAPLLQERGATLWFQGDARLYPMLNRTAIFSGFVDENHHAPSSSIPVLIGDLPFILDAPLTAPLRLSADEKCFEAIKQLLTNAGPPPYLAITWRAGTRPYSANKQNRLMLYKAISATELGAALQSWPGTLISIQRQPNADEQAEIITAAGRNIVDFSHLNDDLESMLSLLLQVDRVVGVSNTNMYLRLGLGLGADVLMPEPADWRWLRQGDTSPWFPGFRVLRETKTGWVNALGKL